jgi:hypothetical protein
MTLYCRNELIRLVALTIRQPDNTGQSLLLTVTTVTLVVHAAEPPTPVCWRHRRQYSHAHRTLHKACKEQSDFWTSAAVQMRSALFWDCTQLRMEVYYRRFGKTLRPHLQRSTQNSPFHVEPDKGVSTKVDTHNWPIIHVPWTWVSAGRWQDIHRPDGRAI